MSEGHHGDNTPSWVWPRHVLARIEARQDELERLVRAGFHYMKESIMAASQADIDAITTGLQGLSSALSDDTAAIQQEIQTLAAQGVDVSGLQAAVSDLSGKVDGVTALVPAPAPADGGDTPAQA